MNEPNHNPNGDSPLDDFQGGLEDQFWYRIDGQLYVADSDTRPDNVVRVEMTEDGFTVEEADPGIIAHRGAGDEVHNPAAAVNPQYD